MLSKPINHIQCRYTLRYNIFVAKRSLNGCWYTAGILKSPAAPAKGQASRALPNSRLLFSKHRIVSQKATGQYYLLMQRGLEGWSLRAVFGVCSLVSKKIFERNQDESGSPNFILRCSGKHKNPPFGTD